MKIYLVYFLLAVIILTTTELSHGASTLGAKKTDGLQNPNISVLVDFLASYKDQEENEKKDPWGFAIKEIELGFSANLDQYARADIYLALHEEDGSYHTEIEEAYLTLLTLPAGLSMKIGKMRATFGKINRFHPDQLPFHEYPFVYQQFFGEEGLTPDGGFSLSYLLPFDAFYSELILEAHTGDLSHSHSSTKSLFDKGKVILNAHWANKFEFADKWFLELGVSYAFSEDKHDNDDELRQYNVMGADLTFKGIFSRDFSFILSGEFLYFKTDSKTFSTGEKEEFNNYGGFVFLEGQFFRDFFLGAGLGITESPLESADKLTEIGSSDEHAKIKNYSAWLTYKPSEFQRYRFQYENVKYPSSTLDEQRFMLQVTFALGYHTHSTNW